MAAKESNIKNQNRCKKCGRIVGLNYNPKTGKMTLAKHKCKE